MDPDGELAIPAIFWLAAKAGAVFFGAGTVGHAGYQLYTEGRINVGSALKFGAATGAAAFAGTLTGGASYAAAGALGASKAGATLIGGIVGGAGGGFTGGFTGGILDGRSFSESLDMGQIGMLSGAVGGGGGALLSRAVAPWLGTGTQATLGSGFVGGVGGDLASQAALNVAGLQDGINLGQAVLSGAAGAGGNIGARYVGLATTSRSSATFEAWLRGGPKAGMRRNLLARMSHSFRRGSTAFYSVLGDEAFARLRAGGEPWPTGFNKANLGRGFYAWRDRATALKYMERLSSRSGYDASRGTRVRLFRVRTRELDRMKSLDLRDFTPAQYDEFMELYSTYGEARPHGYEHVVTPREIGLEDYFSPEAFGRFGR